MNRLYFSSSLYKPQAYIRDVPIEIEPNDKILILYPVGVYEEVIIYSNKNEIDEGKFTYDVYGFLVDIYHNSIKFTKSINTLLDNGCKFFIDREPTKEEIDNKTNLIKQELKEIRINKYLQGLTFEEQMIYNLNSYGMLSKQFVNSSLIYFFDELKGGE